MDRGGSEKQDREALLALYWSSGGPRWKHNTGWASNGANLGDWFGISLDEEGRVSKIDLTRNALEGTIPAALGFMRHLGYLRLSFNSLTGPIPSTFGNLSRLAYLDIGSNQLTGSLPGDLGRLKEVSKIDLSNNLLGGFIPPEFGGMEKLLMCWLEKNHIQGPIPPEMAEIPSLTDFDLTENRLEVRRLQGESLRTWRAQARAQLGERSHAGSFRGSTSRAGSRGGGGENGDLGANGMASRDGSRRGQGMSGAVNVEECLLNLMAKDKEIAKLKEENNELRRGQGAPRNSTARRGIFSFR